MQQLTNAGLQLTAAATKSLSYNCFYLQRSIQISNTVKKRSFGVLTWLPPEISSTHIGITEAAYTFDQHYSTLFIQVCKNISGCQTLVLSKLTLHCSQKLHCNKSCSDDNSHLPICQRSANCPFWQYFQKSKMFNLFTKIDKPMTSFTYRTKISGVMKNRSKNFS